MYTAQAAQATNEREIIIKNVSHTYRNGTCALNNINLEIGVGLFGMLGANGAGKSTLMRIICTLLEPAAGNVTMAGYDVVKDRKKVRNLFGYLPQEFGAWRGKSVEESLHILASLSGLNDKQERTKRVAEVLGMVGLGQVAKRKVKQLSGGMLRRLGIAQALVHNPLVLIMDEPTVGLDPEERLRFRKLMAELSREHIVVLSTHIIADLGSSCSEIALIHEGQLEFTGTPADLIAKAQGRVFELSASNELLQKLELNDDFEIVARSIHEGNNLIRGVARESFRLNDSSPAQNITLEEAHLAFTLDKGFHADEFEVM